MSMRRRQGTVAVGLGAAVVLAVVAWIAGGQIRSPAQIAAQTAAPKPGAITVPAERRVLSSEVIVRGTVRYGQPQQVVLATSTVKQGTGGAGGTDIVTTPPKRGTRVGEGTVAMSVSGRPVFVLRGAQPSHRDMAPGSTGPDVRQLEDALTRMGFFPGPIDGRYDGQTAAAVAAWYQSTGWAPFGSTDTQLEQLRVAQAAAAQARDAYLQSRIAIQTAAHGATPGEIAQARIDVETARDAVNTAALGLRTARIKAQATRELAKRSGSETLAILNEQRDNAAAVAEVTGKRAAVNKAVNALAEAQRNIADAPPGTSASELATLQAAALQAGDDIAVAQADLNAALASAGATRVAGRDAVAKAQTDRRQAFHDASTAAAELIRARQALPTARRQAILAERRFQVLSTPGNTSLQRLVSRSSASEAHGTAAEVSRLARKLGIQVPADEVLFFPTLPLRVDSVRAKRGDSVTGRVMTVTNSRLAVDSSLSINDAKLVRRGAPVTIEEQDLGIKATGKVTQVADRPGTHQVDPGRVYLEVTPGTAPAQLLGASVKLTIAVKSTKQAVLAVPVTALSVGPDGSSRVQVQRAGGRSDYVTVVPGLAANGLVEVRAVHGRLARGDLVVVGSSGAAAGSGAGSGALAGSGSSPGSGSSGASGPSGATGKGATSRGGPSVGTTP
jgi:Putative peptidoglycan binding domain